MSLSHSSLTDVLFSLNFVSVWIIFNLQLLVLKKNYMCLVVVVLYWSIITLRVPH